MLHTSSYTHKEQRYFLPFEYIQYLNYLIPLVGFHHIVATPWFSDGLSIAYEGAIDAST